jgi:hypothetical protein
VIKLGVLLWKIKPYYLLWCLWRKINYINFEDHERSLAELESMFFSTLYTWIAVFVAP